MDPRHLWLRSVTTRSQRSPHSCICTRSTRTSGSSEQIALPERPPSPRRLSPSPSPSPPTSGSPSLPCTMAYYSNVGGSNLPSQDASSPSRRASTFQQHARRGSAIPSYLSSEGAPPPPPYPPSIGVPPTNRSGPSSSSSAGTRSHGHGHARRGSVMDLAAEMVGGQAGVEQLEKARKVSDKIEDRLDQLARPIRPWLPGIGRFLIVVTFLEDALRILTQLSGAFPSLPLVHPMSRADSSVGDAQTRTTTSRCALLPRDPSCASSADPPFLVPCRAEAPRLPLGSLAHVPLDQRPRAAPLLASCTLDRPR